jgi:hypothetical protein
LNDRTVTLVPTRAKRHLEEALDKALEAAKTQKWKKPQRERRGSNGSDIGISQALIDERRHIAAAAADLIAAEHAEHARGAIREGRLSAALDHARQAARLEEEYSTPGAWACFVREILRVAPELPGLAAPAPVVSLPPSSPRPARPQEGVFLRKSPEKTSPEGQEWKEDLKKSQEEFEERKRRIDELKAPAPEAPKKAPRTLADVVPPPRTPTHRAAPSQTAPLSPEERERVGAWVEKHGPVALARAAKMDRTRIRAIVAGTPCTPSTRAALLAAISAPAPVARPGRSGRPRRRSFDEAQLRQLVAEGKSLREIGEAVDATPSLVRQRLVELGLQSKGRPGTRGQPLSEEHQEALCAWFREVGQDALTRHLEVSRATLDRARKGDPLTPEIREQIAAALANRSAPLTRQRQLKVDPEKAKSLHAEGKSYREIARVFGVSIQAVYLAIHPEKRHRGPARRERAEEAAPAPGLSYPELPQDLSGLKPEEIVLVESASPAPAPALNVPSNPEPAPKETTPIFKKEEPDLPEAALRQVVRDVAREAMAAALEVVRERIRAVLDEEIESIRGEIGGGR